MLVLVRKRNQGITIGGDIHVVVLEIRGESVRIGIEADNAIPVHRDEVYAAIQAGKPLRELEDEMDHKENQGA